MQKMMEAWRNVGRDDRLIDCPDQRANESTAACIITRHNLRRGCCLGLGAALKIDATLVRPSVLSVFFYF